MKVSKVKLPAPESVVADLRDKGDSLADLAGLANEEVIASLRSRLKFPAHPHLQKLADTLVGLPLKHLSVRSEPQSPELYAFLTFGTPGVEIHLPGIRSWPPGLGEAFPFDQVNGLVEFMIHFGGMVHGEIPPAALFYAPEEAFLIKGNDPRRDWGGPTGDWEGSLPWYHGCTGDLIIIRRDGAPGVHCHEYDEEEDRFWETEETFEELVTHFADYLLMSSDDPRVTTSPFYY